MIEILAPIEIGNIRLTDFREATDKQIVMAAQLSSFHLQQTVSKERPEQLLCLNDEAAKAGFDPGLETVKFVVENKGVTIGAWAIYNIVTLSDDRDLRTIEGTPLPGVGKTKKSAAIPQRELWALIMSRLLEGPLATVNRKRVDLVAWTFPAEPGLRWEVGGRAKRPDTYALRHLRDDGNMQEQEIDVGRQEEFPVRMVRKGLI